MQIRVLVAAFIILNGTLSHSEDSDRVSVQGYAGVRIGMSVADASNLSGLNLAPIGEVSEDELACFFLTPGGEIGSLFFMVSNGQIARVDVDGPGILTVAGIGVGSLESEVSDAYPDRVIVTPHPYTGPEGHYLTVKIEGAFAIIFETDGEKVERYRAGQYPEVRWIEGCS